MAWSLSQKSEISMFLFLWNESELSAIVIKTLCVIFKFRFYQVPDFVTLKMEKNQNAVQNADSKRVVDSKIQIIVTDHETNTCVLEQEPQGEQEVNPWVAKHTFPASWICTVMLLGTFIILFLMWQCDIFSIKRGVDSKSKKQIFIFLLVVFRSYNI